MSNKPEIPQERQLQFDLIKRAREDALGWAKMHDVPLHQVDFVVPFVETDFSLEVYFFYKKDAEVADCASDGTTARLEDQFRSALSNSGYPSGWLDQISFFVDSDETVKRDYGGSYFNRLR